MINFRGRCLKINCQIRFYMNNIERYREILVNLLANFLQIVCCPDAPLVFPSSHLGAVLLLERKSDIRMVLNRISIYVFGSRDLVSELCCSHMGHETIRQVNTNQVFSSSPSFFLHTFSDTLSVFLHFFSDYAL